MSVDDVVKIKSAYEKMLEDGSAFKSVDMSMLTEPSVEMAGGGLGEQVNNETKHPSLEQEEQPHVGLDNDNTDFSDIDRRMSERMNSLRNKASGNPQKEILALKKRVKRLEEALMLVMETQEKLIK